MRQEFSTYMQMRGLKVLKHREKNFNLCANQQVRRLLGWGAILGEDGGIETELTRP